MSSHQYKPKNFIETLNEILKDGFLGIKLSEYIGEKLIEENIVIKRI